MSDSHIGMGNLISSGIIYQSGDGVEQTEDKDADLWSLALMWRHCEDNTAKRDSPNAIFKHAV